jgi:dephospho-CoA kinase
VRTVAITGNIASGKSTVARLFESWGARRLDADAITRDLQQPGQPVFDAIVRRFGEGILTADGALDRAGLRQIILQDPRARADLNTIVHPAVYREIERRLAEFEAAGVPIGVVEIPLLVETGAAGRFDCVVLVVAPRATTIERLITHRGLDAATAGRFLDAQASPADARRSSDFVIENGGTPEELAAAARDVWRAIADRA